MACAPALRAAPAARSANRRMRVPTSAPAVAAKMASSGTADGLKQPLDKASAKALVDGVQTFIFDCDGELYHDPCRRLCPLALWQG